MLDYCVYLLYRAASALLGSLPLRVVVRIGQLCGAIAWLVAVKYRRLAAHNLRIAFGAEKSPREIRRLTRQHFGTLGGNFLAGFKLNRMPLEEIAKVVTVEGAEAVHAELRNQRSAVFVISHLGNWELFTSIIPHHFSYVRLGTVYQKLGNRFLEAEVSRQRARFRVETFDRSEGFHRPIELLRAGGLVGILADQHAGDHGVWVPFFGRLASTTPLPALLAKRTGAALFAAAMFNDGVGRWRLALTRVDEPRQSVEALTARANDVIQQQITRAPRDWFWVHNRWKLPQPDFLLAHYKRGAYVPETVESLQPFRILIRASNWLGDSVISMPAVRAIKRGRPDAHLTVIAPEKIAAVWKLLPEVDEVLALTSKSLREAVRTIRRQPPFDVAIVFPNSVRSALEVWGGGVPRRVGYAGHRGRWLLNQIVPEPVRKGPPPHQVERYLHLARTLGAKVEADLAAAPRSAGGPMKIGLCPGAEYGPAKRWLPERFAEVAKAVAEQTPVHWILFGTAKDAELGQHLATSLGDRCTNRIGQTTLAELIAELGECRLLLTNDTGTMHLATLLGVPVVAIFGSTEPQLTGPLGEGHRVIRHHVECSPCFLRECPIDFRCMHAVPTDEVTAAVLSYLN